jgi:hypothetical protein
MNQKNLPNESEPYFLIEGPRWGDTEFYGMWLLAAARADALWKEAIKNPIFAQQVDRLLLAYIPDFGIGATVLLSKLETNLVSLAVCLNGEEVELVEEFAMMVEMGFFVLTGQRYQMAVPAPLDITKIKRATLKFAETEDENYYLHPEYLVATMPYAEAKAWQTCLRKMDETRRLADRLLLLETSIAEAAVSISTAHGAPRRSCYTRDS